MSKFEQRTTCDYINFVEATQKGKELMHSTAVIFIQRQWNVELNWKLWIKPKDVMHQWSRTESSWNLCSKQTFAYHNYTMLNLAFRMDFASHMTIRHSKN